MAISISFEGDVALVTGAARGTGAATARRLVEAGARVAVTDIDTERGSKTAQSLGDAAKFYPLDTTSPEQWAHTTATVEADLGPITMLVNNAAILHLGSIISTTPEQYRRIFEVNELGPFLGIQAVAPGMISRGRGGIVNVSSIDGLHVVPGTGAYSASKFAVRGLTKVAALELGQFGIRVNSVCPAAGNPEMIAPFLPDRDLVAEQEAGIPPLPNALYTVGKMSDVADAILYLLSDLSGFVTGADLMVDGGHSVGTIIDVPGVTDTESR